MHRYICNICGAYLDPGERCDCKSEREERKRKLGKMYRTEKNGQMRMFLGGQVDD